MKADLLLIWCEIAWFRCGNCLKKWKRCGHRCARARWSWLAATRGSRTMLGLLEWPPMWSAMDLGPRWLQWPLSFHHADSTRRTKGILRQREQRYNKLIRSHCSVQANILRDTNILYQSIHQTKETLPESEQKRSIIWENTIRKEVQYRAPKQ